ncbi:MAG: chloride channel protein, partial [Rhodospirillales bacterium]|nr:chloride channel protein [Rhodospirillales bacterium]
MTSPRLWARRVVVWIGCIVVSLVAIAFAMLANAASDLFLHAQAPRPWIALIICPVGLVVSFLLTRHLFPGAQGSGIPQVIATQHLEDRALIARILSPRIAIGKIALTLLGLASGASIGREGPTVQVGACIMHLFARMLRLPRPELERALVLAGGAAGVAAAFNTPIAGVVFAIEELSHAFESRTSGTVLTGVIMAGITTAALMGNYTYFGHTAAELNFGIGWVAVLLCSVTGGIGGGLFSATLIRAADGLPGRAGRLLMRHPVAFAALCGLIIAVIGIVSGGTTYGTGYEQARAMVEGTADLGPSYVLLKFLATVV